MKMMQLLWKNSLWSLRKLSSSQSQGERKQKTGYRMGRAEWEDCMWVNECQCRMSTFEGRTVVMVTRHWTGLWKVVRMAGFMYLLPQFKTAESRLAPWPSRFCPPSQSPHPSWTRLFHQMTTDLKLACRHAQLPPVRILLAPPT